MTEIYASDFEDMSFEDWEDMFCNPTVNCRSTWEGWKESTEVFFDVEEDLGTRFLPSKEFKFLFNGKRKEPFEFSEELTLLMKDIVDLKAAKAALYSAHIWDETLEEGIGIACDAFSEHYDNAMARALIRMLAELQGVKDEFPLAAE